MSTPPILEELRRVRHRISEAIGHDPRKIVEYYAALRQSNDANIVIENTESASKEKTDSFAHDAE